MTISIPPGPVTAGAGEEHDWDAEAALSLGGELPEWRLVVAPARGIFHAAPVTTDSDPRPADGQADSTVLGYVEARRDQQPIVAPWEGAIMEWLVQDGDPVGLGQPVARLLPHDAADVPADTTSAV